jgi:hypothetical protein
VTTVLTVARGSGDSDNSGDSASGESDSGCSDSGGSGDSGDSANVGRQW